MRHTRRLNTGLKSRKRVFDFIVQYKRTHDGIFPTYREIIDACNEAGGVSSTSQVNNHLINLCRLGLLKKDASGSHFVVGGEWIYHEQYVQVTEDDS